MWLGPVLVVVRGIMHHVGSFVLCPNPTPNPWRLSSYGSRAPDHGGSVVVTWAYLPHVWDLSSLIGDGTCISCVAKWIFYHRATREVLISAAVTSVSG